MILPASRESSPNTAITFSSSPPAKSRLNSNPSTITRNADRRADHRKIARTQPNSIPSSKLFHNEAQSGPVRTAVTPAVVAVNKINSSSRVINFSSLPARLTTVVSDCFNPCSANPASLAGDTAYRFYLRISASAPLALEWNKPLQAVIQVCAGMGSDCEPVLI